MDGFVTDYVSTYLALRHEMPEFEQYRQIMQGHTPDQVPVLGARWPAVSVCSTTGSVRCRPRRSPTARSGRRRLRRASS